MSGSPLPIVLGAGAVGGLLWYASRRKADAPSEPAAGKAAADPVAADASPPGTTGRPAPASASASSPPISTASPLPGRWVWPVEVYQDRKPIITNPWSMQEGRVHRGVDLMFAR